MAIYNTIIGEKAHSWAKAGVARSRLAMGELAAARRLLEALVTESPD